MFSISDPIKLSLILTITLLTTTVCYPSSVNAIELLPESRETKSSELLWDGIYAGLNAGNGWGTNSKSGSGWGASLNGGASLTATGRWTHYSYDSGTSNYTNNGSTSWNAVAIGATQSSVIQSGFIGGAQFGYNHLLNNRFVVGIETDIQGTLVSGSSSATGFFDKISTPGNNLTTGITTGTGVLATNAGIDYLGTARGRIGFLLLPSLMIYGTAGISYGGAWARLDTNGALNIRSNGNGTIPFPSVIQPFKTNNSQSYLLIGYSVGGGAEWMFTANWSLRAEALYYNLGNINISSANSIASGWSNKEVETAIPGRSYLTYASPTAITSGMRVNYQGVVARLGINYHFNIGSVPFANAF